MATGRQINGTNPKAKQNKTKEKLKKTLEIELVKETHITELNDELLVY